MSYVINDEEIIAIRDECLPSQGEQFDCIAFARKILAESKDALASRLIDAWCDAHNSQITWAKAIEITAIVTKMSDEEKARLLALD
jgi:hypothetical protein